MASVKLIAKANFPSQYGKFSIAAFRGTSDSHGVANPRPKSGACHVSKQHAAKSSRGVAGMVTPCDGKQEHIAIVKGTVKGKSNVPVRMHSECLTGDVFHSLRCDCHAQLEAALIKIGKMPRGAILYMRQEGRGIGLGNKIRAYGLQDKGMDTVEANHALGFPSDMRDYKIAADILRLLGIRSIALITNNPGKMEDLALHRIKITRRIPHEYGRTKYNRAYLLVKKNKLGHIMRKV